MKKTLLVSVIIFGIIALVFTTYWLKNTRGVSYPSTPSQIETQMEFNQKLVAEQEAFQLQLNAAMKAAALRTDSLIKEAGNHLK